MKFERHHEILKRLSKFGSVKVSDLSNSLNVTKETIRSDLNELAGAWLSDSMSWRCFYRPRLA